jgi:transposase, IS5 family
MMVHFRKRLSLEVVGRINEEVVKESKKESNPIHKEEKRDKDSDEPPSSPKIVAKVETEQREEAPENKGQLLLDASCAPADIRYPTDLSLLNQAREQTEVIIDALYKQVQENRRCPFDR